MAYTPDLDAYFDRIGYEGPCPPNLSTLNAIIERHVEAIPFENIDVLLGRGVDLDPAAIEKKLLHDRRGGYCFEQNTLLLHILESLGYVVQPLSARVRIQRPRDFTPPRTHMFLRVELADASWLVDVGVGGLSPTCALQLVCGIEQKTPLEPRRLVMDGSWASLQLRSPEARIFHQVYFGEEWHDVCEFTLEPMPLVDRELANWFTSTHPRSHFRDSLMVARSAPHGRVTLLNDTLSFRRLGGSAETRTLASHSELLSVLADQFGIRLPDAPELRWAGSER